MAVSILVTPLNAGAPIAVATAAFVRADPTNTGHTRITYNSGNTTATIDVADSVSDVNDLFNA